jgi:FkbM family methyltransferase
MLDHDYLRYYNLKSNDVILDLGATLGDFPKEILPQIKEKNILYIAVEPSYWNLIKLSEFLNTNLLNNSILISSAVSDRDGIVDFNISHSNVLHTTSERIEGWGNTKYDRNQEFFTKVPIISFKLDTLLEFINKDISFLKCDIEGAELDVFLGSKKLNKINNLAIAAYHIINNEQTHKILEPYMKSYGFKTKLEEGILYCSR